MIKDPKLKGRVKKGLIGLNAGLGTIFIALLAAWLLVLRPSQFDMATHLDQYAYFEMDNLPEIANKIEADYFGSAYAARTLDQDEDFTGTIYEDVDEPGKPLDENIITSHADPDAILDKAEAILAQSNKLIKDEKQPTPNPEPSPGTPVTSKYAGQATISLIVTNLGLNKKSTEMALTLPKQCGLGFLPYTKKLKPLLHKAQKEGHEIYLYMPLQTSRSYENPGKYALLGNLPPEENMVRLNVILNSHARYDGVYSSHKEVFTSNPHQSELLFDHLDDKNLIFVMGKPVGNKTMPHIASRENIVHTSLIIDKEPDAEAIRASFEKLIKISREHGHALGYTQGYTLTIEMIKEWIPKLHDRGIKLIPISKTLRE